MTCTREIIHSLFDWRSSGGIIMSYIETPREEYKKRFDLVVKQIEGKKDNFWGVRFAFNLQTAKFTPIDIEKLIFMLYNDICYRNGKRLTLYSFEYDLDTRMLSFDRFKSVMFNYEWDNRDSNHLLIRYHNIMFDSQPGRRTPNAGDVLEKEMYECFKNRFIIIRR